MTQIVRETGNGKLKTGNYKRLFERILSIIITVGIPGLISDVYASWDLYAYLYNSGKKQLPKEQRRKSRHPQKLLTDQFHFARDPFFIPPSNYLPIYMAWVMKSGRTIFCDGHAFGHGYNTLIQSSLQTLQPLKRLYLKVSFLIPPFYIDSKKKRNKSYDCSNSYINNLESSGKNRIQNSNSYYNFTNIIQILGNTHSMFIKVYHDIQYNLYTVVCQYHLYRDASSVMCIELNIPVVIFTQYASRNTHHEQGGL